MAARAVHIGACLLILNICIFDRIIIGSSVKRSRIVAGFWEKAARWMMLLSVVAAGISGVFWFAFVAISMSGLPPAEALHVPVVRLVLTKTQFGFLWQFRAGFWLALASVDTLALFLSVTHRFRTASVWLTGVLAALLLGSLAWSGHGNIGEPARWHFMADALHLLASAIWPTGLLPLMVLLVHLRATSSEGHDALALIVSRFSAMSLWSVAVLGATGLVNSCYMLRSFSDLSATLYGRVLLLKIVLFCLMVGLGSYNLLHLKPKMIASGDGESAACLRRSVTTELLMGIAVLVAVSLLGLISPPT